MWGVLNVSHDCSLALKYTMFYIVRTLKSPLKKHYVTSFIWGNSYYKNPIRFIKMCGCVFISPVSDCCSFRYIVLSCFDVCSKLFTPSMRFPAYLPPASVFSTPGQPLSNRQRLQRNSNWYKCCVQDHWTLKLIRYGVAYCPGDEAAPGKREPVKSEALMMEMEDKLGVHGDLVPPANTSPGERRWYRVLQHLSVLHHRYHIYRPHQP